MDSPLAVQVVLESSSTARRYPGTMRCAECEWRQSCKERPKADIEWRPDTLELRRRPRGSKSGSRETKQLRRRQQRLFPRPPKTPLSRHLHCRLEKELRAPPLKTGIASECGKMTVQTCLCSGNRSSRTAFENCVRLVLLEASPHPQRRPRVPLKPSPQPQHRPRVPQRQWPPRMTLQAAVRRDPAMATTQHEKSLLERRISLRSWMLR